MTDLKLKDEKAREKITTILDKNILVEAGAGSGKTTSLVKRLVTLIKSGQYSIDEISAITFTRKAAAELKGRFESKLEEELKTVGNKEEKNNMKKALDNLDQCFTGTIHSFCAKILRERPVEAGIDPDFDEIDEIEEKVLREESWQEFLKKSTRENKEIMNKLQNLGISPLELKESFKKINLYPEVSIETEKINKPDLDTVMERVIEFSKKAAEYIPKQEPEKGYDTLQSTVNYVLKMKNYLDLNEDKNIIKLLSRFDKNQKVTLYKWKDRDTAREYRDQKTKFLKENHINPALREWRQYLHYYIYKFLEPARNFYERKRREKGVTNFQDLLLLTARMLRENSEVRKYFHEKYKTLLVDEFQDTDPVQAEIIFYLTTNNYQEKRWDKCQPEAGSLFVVGDPKQSIYRFRRADIDIYQKVKELIRKSGGEVLSLSSNFRSLDSIADYLNPIFSDIFPEDDNKYQAQFAPINTVHENKYDNGVKYYTISDDYSNKDEIVAKDAENIARIIRSALDGSMEFYRTNEELEKGLTPEAKSSDFMILLRYKDKMDVYARTLEKYGIPTIMTGDSTLADSEEIKSLYELFKFLDDIDNELLLVSILKGLFFGINDNDLYQFKKANGRFNIYSSIPDSLNKASKEKLKNAYIELRKYHKWSQNNTPSVFLEKVIEDLGLVPFTLRKEMKNSRTSNLYYLLEKMRQLEDNSYSGFHEMVNHFEILMENSPEEELNIEEEKEGVRIMNLHKAKGLQAPVVFLAHPYKKVDKDPEYHVNREGNDSKGYFTFTKSLKYNNTKTLAEPINWDKYLEEEKKYKYAEEKRQLYVAATRAKNMLIISDQEKSKKKNPWKKLLENAKKDEHVIEITEVNYKKKEIEKEEISIDEFKKNKEEIHDSLERLKNESYLNISSEDIKDKSEIFKVKREEGGSQNWGTLIHLILEELVNKKEVSDVFIERNLKKYDFDLDRKDEVVKVINDFKESKLWTRIKQSENVLTEVPFKLKINKDKDLYNFVKDNMNSIEEEVDFDNKKGDIILSGVIDLVFKEDDERVIVDYKTDRAEDDSEIKKLKEAYEPQVELYEKVWEDMSDSKIKEAEIKFVPK